MSPRPKRADNPWSPAARKNCQVSWSCAFFKAGHLLCSVVTFVGNTSLEDTVVDRTTAHRESMSDVKASSAEVALNEAKIGSAGGKMGKYN